ncbi:MAG: ATP-binding cassette domain-containing protein, partial [Lachnospiraceae bacterium]|nr:ATP-binding cassette domain-containing protein [Lachnospiraceae bacterium]
MSTIVETKDLCKYYGKEKNKVKALHNANLTIQKGEITVIIGKSGSGKSTLLHILGGLDKPTSGKVFIDGKNIFSLNDENLTIFRRRKIGFVFQAYNLISSLNVWENIVLPAGLDG